MKKLFFAIAVLLLAACTKEESTSSNDNVSNTTAPAVVAKSGRLKFNSTYELSQVVDMLRVNDIYKVDVRQMPNITRSGGGENLPPENPQDDEFKSLREYLIEQGLREFSDEELAEIVAEELEYEPVDSIIIDPYLMSILNEDREVQIEDKIYHYVEDGVVVYDESETNFDVEEYLESVNAEVLEHGEVVHGTIADFIRIEFGENIETEDDIVIDEDGNPIDDDDIGGGDNNGNNKPDPDLDDNNPEFPEPEEGGSGNGSANNGSNTPSNANTNYSLYLSDGSIKLTNGVTIPQSNIATATHVNKKQNWIEKILGININRTTITKNFDSNHRMALSLFSQDYIIYSSIGMSVRMQKKKLGIWWRIKAQEFRYGWSAIECVCEVSKPNIRNDRVMPSAEAALYETYPTALIKKFPFTNSEVVLFHVPFVDYDVKTGNLNTLYSTCMKKIKNKIQAWCRHESNKQYAGNPNSIYTVDENKGKVYLIVPQGEERSTNQGRDVVRWDKQWFSGNFSLSFKTNLNDSWSIKPGNISSNRVDFNRGKIYGAVKYNDKWRACVIETK